MSNPLTNLGDYNIARDTLKAAGGNWQSLYNSIGDTAAAKSVIALVKRAKSIKKAAKALYTVVKLKIQGASKAKMDKAVAKLGYTLATAEGIRKLIFDIIGISDIKKYCVMVVY